MYVTQKLTDLELNAARSDTPHPSIPDQPMTLANLTGDSTTSILSARTNQLSSKILQSESTFAYLIE